MSKLDLIELSFRSEFSLVLSSLTAWTFSPIPSPTSELSLDLRPRLTLLDLRLRGWGCLLSPVTSGTGGMAGGRAFRSAPRAAPRGGSARMGGMRGGGMYGGGGAMMAPPLMGGYGFSPFGFGFSPFFFPGGGFLFNIMFLLFAVNFVQGMIQQARMAEEDEKDKKERGWRGSDDDDDFFDI